MDQLTMAITIKQPPAATVPETQALAPSPHAEAAQQLGTDVTTETITKVTTVDGVEEAEVLSHTQDTTHHYVPPKKDTITVGMEFKMPLAQYVMITFQIARASDCAPEEADDIYVARKDWVESRINALIEEQQQQAE